MTKLPAILTIAVLAALTFSTAASAEDTATAAGVPRCEADGSWSVDWTITAPVHGGLWSILPGMYQDPRPWQPDSEPFTLTTTGHGDQPEASVGIVYGWQDGPTGQWVVGTVANPLCISDEPSAEVVSIEPVHAATAIVAPVAAVWLTSAELKSFDLRHGLR